MQHKQDGFSLIEVLVSITILSIISVSLISIFSQSLAASRDSTELTFANYLAKNATSYIKREAIEATANEPFSFVSLSQEALNPNLLDLYVYVYVEGTTEPITTLKGSITNATLNQSFPTTK